ncbi:DUF948 domain-containing protein [Gorillibacterium sp. CAU 1737]|uniref:DUF948 domain-containing protein n=1 Tax=Gorillibacterium sp. CAU 1737 TaxID=3140362 RepID=UPI0032602924
MNIIVEVSIALVAVAFAVLVIFLVRTLNMVQASLKETNQTISDVQRELNDVSGEVKGLIRNTNQITMDVRHKMKALDSLFGTVENVGDTLEGVTSSLKNASSRFATNVNHNMRQVETTENKPLYRVLNTVSSAIDIWQRLKVHRMNRKREAAGS